MLPRLGLLTVPLPVVVLFRGGSLKLILFTVWFLDPPGAGFWLIKLLFLFSTRFRTAGGGGGGSRLTKTNSKHLKQKINLIKFEFEL